MRYGLTSWTLDPTVLLGALALGLGYVWLLRRNARTTELTWPPMSRLAFAAGLFVLLIALESPIDVGGDHYLFSLHMLQHILLAMVVPPLILLGLPHEWLSADRFRVSAFFANITFNVVLAVWHLPFLYEATLLNQLVHVLEHLTFLGAGLLFWWPIIAPAGTRAMTTIGKIAYLALAGVPPTILGLAFILSPTVLYPFYAAAPRVTALSPLADQVMAGLVMFGLGNLIYFGAISIIFFGLDDKAATAGDEALVDVATHK